MLLNKIQVLPQEKVEDEYAKKLLKYKSIVEVDHSVRYVQNESLLKVVVGKPGFSIVHYAVVPKQLSIGLLNDNYFINIEIYGKISDLEGHTVYQFQKAVSLNIDPEQVLDMKAKPFCFQDLFPLIPGRFKFDLLIKNNVSKEFTSVEKDITVPKPSFAPWMSPLILSRVEKRGEAA